MTSDAWVVSEMEKPGKELFINLSFENDFTEDWQHVVRCALRNVVLCKSAAEDCSNSHSSGFLVSF